jgi:thiol-disulfide isomerase/thioredoxin
MKKAVTIIAAVVVIIAATYIADRATRRHSKVMLNAKVADSGGGGPVPDVTLKELGGKEINLSQYKGKVVLLNFWATWCEPCRGEIPELIQLQRKYSARGFTVLGVDVDQEGPSAVVKFIDQERFDVDGSKAQMNYPTVIGNDDTAEKLGGLFGYPTSILIGRDGKQVQRILGAINYDELSKTIESQL